MPKKIKVCHLTSAHKRTDIRIFQKQCLSLAKNYEVCLVVADGYGNGESEGVKIYDTRKPTNRFFRIFKTIQDVYSLGLKLNADIYHLHDPELLLIAKKLKRAGKIVIFDAHEDAPQQILSKPYLNRFIAKILSDLLSYYEKHTCKRLDFIITATPYIRNKFLLINQNCIDINNYPILSELFWENIPWENKENQVTYLGGITKIRGIKQLIKSLKYCQSENEDVFLNLVGEFPEKGFEEEMKSISEFKHVIEHGVKNRLEVKDILSKSVAGIVTFLAEPNHINSQPNKMFEYMSAGIPVICSNFPLWKEIVEKNYCGICVDPQNPEEIGIAISKLLLNSSLAKEMGENGRRVVMENYNWEKEETKLYMVYSDVCSKIA